MGEAFHKLMKQSETGETLFHFSALDTVLQFLTEETGVEGYTAPGDLPVMHRVVKELFVGEPGVPGKPAILAHDERSVSLILIFPKHIIVTSSLFSHHERTCYQLLL